MSRLHRAVAVAILLAGCAATPPPAAPPAPAPPPSLGPLVDLVPDGAEQVVDLRPTALLGSPAIRALIDRVVPRAQRRALADRTGIDPDRVREAVVAEYPSGFVVLVRGGVDAEAVVRKGAARMLPVQWSSDQPFLRRAGPVGSGRRELLALRPDVVAIAGGRTGAAMAQLVARAATGEWSEGARPALGTEVSLALRGAAKELPAVLYVPRPLDLPPGYGTSLLLAREQALALGLRAEGPSTVGLVVDLRGSFPEGAGENFRTLVKSVARTDLGAALGLLEGIDTLRIQAEDERVVLRMELPAATLGRGLAVLFGADVRAVLSPMPSGN